MRKARFPLNCILKKTDKGVLIQIPGTDEGFWYPRKRCGYSESDPNSFEIVFADYYTATVTSIGPRSDSSGPRDTRDVEIIEIVTGRIVEDSDKNSPDLSPHPTEES